MVISRAAGPGRYDQNYEKYGQDYPKGYIRWTEGRNIGEYIRLLKEKRLQLGNLINKEFSVLDASTAYLELRKDSRKLGVVFKY